MPLDRREFLTETGRFAAGAALGVAALGSGAARAASAPRLRKQEGANEAVALAVIGCGGRAGGLMSWAMEAGARIVAVCDVNEQRLATAAEAVRSSQGHNPQTIRDFRAILEDAAIDAAIVATPHHWHAPISVRLLDAGKHVYCEKPAAHVFSEGRQIIEAQRRSGKVFQHGTQMRSSEVTAAAAEVLASGILGEIKQSKAWGVEPRGNGPDPVADSDPPDYLDWDLWLGPAAQRPFNANRFGHWHNYRDYGNGEIGNDGSHDLDMALFGLGVQGLPNRITAHGSRIHRTGEGDYPDNMLVAYQYGDDKVLIYENRNFAPYRMHGFDNGNIFYGTEGYMLFSRRGYFQTYLGGEEEQGPGMQGGVGNQENIRVFLDAVRSEDPSIGTAGAEVAHWSSALANLGDIAQRLQRVIHFDPERETIVGDDEAAALLTKEYREPWGFA